MQLVIGRFNLEISWSNESVSQTSKNGKKTNENGHKRSWIIGIIEIIREYSGDCWDYSTYSNIRGIFPLFKVKFALRHDRLFWIFGITGIKFRLKIKICDWIIGEKYSRIIPNIRLNSGIFGRLFGIIWLIRIFSEYSHYSKIYFFTKKFVKIIPNILNYSGSYEGLFD